MKKTSFVPLMNVFLILFLKDQKLLVKETKLFFSSEIWGHFAFTFCRYLNPNMRAFIFCRYCPSILFCHQIWKTKKNSKIQGNDMGSFRRSFFPFNALDMPSFNNSVVLDLNQKMLSFKPRKILGLPSKWNSSQVSTWVNKCHRMVWAWHTTTAVVSCKFFIK